MTCNSGSGTLRLVLEQQLKGHSFRQLEPASLCDHLAGEDCETEVCFLRSCVDLAGLWGELLAWGPVHTCGASWS